MRKTSFLFLTLLLFILSSCHESKQKIIEKAKIGFSECAKVQFPRPTDLKIEDYEVLHVDDSLCVMNTHVMYRYNKGMPFKFVMLRYKGGWYGNIEYMEYGKDDKENGGLKHPPYASSLTSLLWETRYSDYSIDTFKDRVYEFAYAHLIYCKKGIPLTFDVDYRLKFPDKEERE